MFRIIRQLISLLIIAAIVFLVLSLWKGGDPFRWFGKKSEQAAEVIREKTEEVGKEADRIKNKTQRIKASSEKVRVGLKETGRKIKKLAGSKTGDKD